MTPKPTLKKQAEKLWLKYRRANKRPTPKDKEVLVNAYWANCLPKDNDYSPYQWVENGCPPIL